MILIQGPQPSDFYARATRKEGFKDVQILRIISIYCTYGHTFKLYHEILKYIRDA